MSSIYDAMKKDWDTYTLMAGIALIEEMSKPTSRIEQKNYKGKISFYTQYRSLRLKMKDEPVIRKWFDITKFWEEKLQLKLLGKDEKIRFDAKSQQHHFFFSPTWLYAVLSTVKMLPSYFTNTSAYERIRNYRKTRSKKIFNQNDIDSFQQMKNLYSAFFTDKFLAAGAFIVSFDFECRGAQSGSLALCMSEKYKDFLKFMNRVANHWGWATKPKLSPVSMEYNRKIGINASNQFQFMIKRPSLQEIYELAGPVINQKKHRCLDFHIKRIQSKNSDVSRKPRETKNKLLAGLPITGYTAELQFLAGVGLDVVNQHLNDLLDEGLVIKERCGKRNIWRLTHGSKCGF